MAEHLRSFDHSVSHCLLLAILPPPLALLALILIESIVPGLQEPVGSQSEAMASHPIEAKADGKLSSLPKRHINVPIGASISFDQPT